MTDTVDSQFFIVEPNSARSRYNSDLVICNGLGFVSGVLPVDLSNDMTPLPEMIEAQAERIFSNLDAILATAAIKQRRLVSVQIRLVNFDRLYERMNRAYSRCVGSKNLPTRSCAGVVHLTRGALVEMDFIVLVQP
jgi:enamine deaminase RidA (YjgF/YER057c/UK114 family)